MTEKNSVEGKTQAIKLLLAKRQWKAAEALLASSFAKPKQHAQASYLLAMIRLKTNFTDEARTLFEQSLKLDPDLYEASIELAEICINKREYDKALQVLNDLSIEKLADAYYLFKAGLCYKRLYRFTLAFDFIEKANANKPQQTQILTQLASVAASLGKIQLATNIYTRLLEKQPANQSLHYEYSLLHKATENTHINTMLKLESQIHSAQNNSVYLHYAIGKEYEDLNEWTKAFKHYQYAGEQAKKLSKYQVKGDLKLVETLKTVCDQSYLTLALNQSNEQKQSLIQTDQESEDFAQNVTPIFIVGFPRSGTTLLDKILSSHDDIGSIDESFYFQVAMQLEAGHSPLAVPSQETIKRLPSLDHQEIANRYIQLVKHRLTASPYFIEKLPENFLFLGVIARAFPNAKLIYMQRNPMDQCLALFKQPYFRYAYDLDDLAAFYQAGYGLIEHWREQLGERLITLPYEDLVSNPEHTLRELFNKLGINFDSKCLSFHERNTATSSASKVQIKQPIHTKSIGKWQHLKAELAPLESKLKAAGIAI